MRKIIIVFILFLNFTNLEAQIILSEDTNFCVPQPHNLYALSAVQSSMATDDLHDIVVPIGFNFWWRLGCHSGRSTTFCSSIHFRTNFNDDLFMVSIRPSSRKSKNLIKASYPILKHTNFTKNVENKR